VHLGNDRVLGNRFGRNGLSENLPSVVPRPHLGSRKCISFQAGSPWHSACECDDLGSLGPDWSSKGNDSNIIDRRLVLHSPFDEEKLRVVREFLQREFRAWVCRDYFAFDKNAQVFVIEGTRIRQTLLIPNTTFDQPDFGLLLNRHLMNALTSADGIPVTLTPDGPRY
jgi:hypothetical protein